MTCGRINFNGPRINVPEVNVNHAPLAFGEVPFEFTEVEIPGGKRVEIYVAEPGAWLLRVWFGLEPAPESEVSITSPDNYPDVASFFRVTDELGHTSVDLLTSDPSLWYVRVVLCGRVGVSPPIAVGF
jgi:hypothetical protein